MDKDQYQSIATILVILFFTIALMQNVIAQDSNSAVWYTVFGKTITSPQTVVYGNKTYIIVRGIDNFLYYKYWTADSGWDVPWVSLQSASADKPAAAIANNKLHVVVRGVDNQTYYNSMDLPTDNWLGWQNLNKNISSAPTVIASGDTLYLFVRGINDEIYYRMWKSNVWNGWTTVPGTTIDIPSVALLGNFLHLIVRGTDNGVYHKKLDISSSVWSDWISTSGGSLSTPALTASNNKLYLIVRGGDNVVYYSTFNGTWNTWESLAGTTQNSPSIGVFGDSLFVVVRGGNNGTYYKMRNITSDKWLTDWTSMNLITYSPPKFLATEKRLDLFTQSTDNEIYQSVWSPEHGWATSINYGFSVSFKPTVAVHYFPFTVSLDRNTATPIPDYNYWTEERMKNDIQRFEDLGVDFLLISTDIGEIQNSTNAYYYYRFFDLLQGHGLKAAFHNEKNDDYLHPNWTYEESRGANVYFADWVYNNFANRTNYFQFKGKPLLVIYDSTKDPNFYDNRFTVRHECGCSQDKMRWNWLNMIDPYPRLSPNAEETTIFFGFLEKPGQGPEYGWKFPRTESFARSQWSSALDLQPRLIKLATYNDFWEGHFIERNTLDGTLMFQISKDYISTFKPSTTTTTTLPTTTTTIVSPTTTTTTSTIVSTTTTTAPTSTTTIRPNQTTTTSTTSIQTTTTIIPEERGVLEKYWYVIPIIVSVVIAIITLFLVKL